MRALWAFEPFHQDTQRIQGMHRTLTQIVGSPQNIEVGFVVTRTEPSLSLAFDVPPEERFGLYPLRATKLALEKAKVKVPDRNIHVVDYETYSNTRAVDRFLALAKTQKSDVIALFTHAKQGYIRLAVGSFAETAIHRSKVDLLILNPKTKTAPKIKNILFANDFSLNSKKQLLRVIDQCKKSKAHLTVFHHAEFVYKWSLNEASPKIKAYRKKVDTMKAWVEGQGKKAGVPTQVFIASEFQATADLILRQAKKSKADLIAVTAKTGPIAALMGGSVTRQVLRSSPAPVWVLK